MLAYQPTFSVLLPAREATDFDVRETIESVCAQVYLRWELCVVVRPENLSRVRLIAAPFDSSAGVMT